MKPERMDKYRQAKQLKESGMSFAAIGRELGVPVTTVQRWCAEYQTKRNPYTGEEMDVDPGNPLPDIELLEKLVRDMLEAGAPAPVIATVVATLGKLRKDWESSQVRAGRMLHVEKALEFINRIGGELIQAFIDVCPDAPERVDKVLAAMRPPRNDKLQIQNLIGR